MPAAKYPSVEYLRQCFRYEDGKLFWLHRPRSHFPTPRSFHVWNSSWAGKEAGFVWHEKREKRCKHSRHRVKIGKHNYYRHVIVWAIHHGEWIVGLDHKNRDTLDDRIENLRIATNRQNIQNSSLRQDNQSGFKGVYRKRSKWGASIRIDGRLKHLGYFDSPIDAHAAYTKAAREFFGEFASDGT